jgi:hypothetical protein
VGEGEAPTLLQEGLHLRLGYPEGDATTPPGTDVGAVQYLREVRIDGRAQPQVAFLVRFARVARAARADSRPRAFLAAGASSRTLSG